MPSTLRRPLALVLAILIGTSVTVAAYVRGLERLGESSPAQWAPSPAVVCCRGELPAVSADPAPPCAPLPLPEATEPSTAG